MTVFEVDDDGRLAPLRDETPVPDGAYTTFRTYHGDRLLRLERHAQRLEQSARLQGRPAGLDRRRLRRALRAALEPVRAAGDSRLRVTFAPPRLILTLGPFEPPPRTACERGVACATVSVHRFNPHAKDTRFLATSAEAYRQLPPGLHEGLMLGADGALLEGLSSNVFAVLEGTLRTEGARVLAGVTRAIVLELAQGLLPVRLQAVRLEDLARLEECFLTSVSRGVLPVVSIDGRRVGGGEPGPITRALAGRLTELVEREACPP